MKTISSRWGRIHAGALAAAVAVLAACAGPSGRAPIPAEAASLSAQDLQIVECALPGEVRRLGNMTYLGPRRPVRTTARDCQIRGGEYVAFDRADYTTALRFWMQQAELGDPEAQTVVGEIYERGLGSTPNYEAAVIWYRRAADQGYNRAQFNLATLYERGLGVEEDRFAALNLYRRAWGLEEDSIIFRDVAEQERLRAELERIIEDRDQEMRLLERQLEALQQELQSERGETARAGEEIEALQAWISRLEDERRASNQRLAGLGPRTREPGQAGEGLRTDLSPDRIEPTVVQGMDFGRYFALVIGNQDYRYIEPLATPRNDAARVARTLRDAYGFEVRLIEDASDVAILAALNELNDVLRPEDNLLVYYAGHGTLLDGGARTQGYWLPVNAEAPPVDTYWVPNEQISGHLDRLPARRILVVADSCYAGLLEPETGSGSLMFLGATQGYTPGLMALTLPKRARLLISSGGESPVLDDGGDGHSVFARAFLEELEGNDGILAAPALYRRIRDRMAGMEASSEFGQEPEIRAIKSAGHELGDFFFVRVDH